MNQEKEHQGFIPHSRPSLGRDEAQAAAEVIASGRIAQGRKVREFEAAFAEKMGTAHAACASSGTAALHLALSAVGIEAGDEVIIPSFVCTALLNAVNYTGATPVFADIDPETYNLDPGDVKNRLTGRTRAVVVPHMFGMPADIEGLLDLNVPLIEDCAQAVGSRYRGEYTGTFGRAAIFSFYATKVMATGEGGMVVSDAGDIIDRVRDLREYDNRKTYEIRYNYKMTDIHASLGLAQLNRLDAFLRKRREIAKQYHRSFRTLPLKLPPQDPGHIFFRYVVESSGDCEAFIEKLREKGIGCARPVYLPLHRYSGAGNLPRTEAAWRKALSIPIYPELSATDVDRVIEAVVSTCEETKR